MKTLDALRSIETASVDQYGLISSAQAQKIGIDRTTLSRLVDAGDLESIRRGVYGTVSSSIDQLRELRAAWLSTAPSLFAFERVNSLSTPVVALESALAVHRLGNLIPAKHTFITSTRKQSRHHDLLFVRKDFSKNDVTVADGMLVTTVERTVKDLAERRTDGGHLADVVNSALKRSLVTPEQIINALSDSAQQYGYPDSRHFAEKIICLGASEHFPLTWLTDSTHASLNQAIERFAAMVDTEKLQSLFASISDNAVKTWTPEVMEGLRALSELLSQHSGIKQISRDTNVTFTQTPTLSSQAERTA